VPAPEGHDGPFRGARQGFEGWDEPVVAQNRAPARRRDPGADSSASEGRHLRPERPAHVAESHPPAWRIYRYYGSLDAIADGYDSCPITSAPAADVEGAVLGHVQKLVAAPELVAGTLTAARREGEDEITEREVTVLLADSPRFGASCSPPSRLGSCNCTSSGSTCRRTRSKCGQGRCWNGRCRRAGRSNAGRSGSAVHNLASITSPGQRSRAVRTRSISSPPAAVVGHASPSLAHMCARSTALLPHRRDARRAAVLSACRWGESHMVEMSREYQRD
jgi:hypothetical protein